MYGNMIKCTIILYSNTHLSITMLNISNNSDLQAYESWIDFTNIRVMDRLSAVNFLSDTLFFVLVQE